MNFCEFRYFQVNPSGAPRQLPLHKGAMSRCDFRLCATEKTNAEFKFSKLKVCTLFFCGTVARHPLPSSGRKVSRVSVTEGACGTERRHIFLFSHRSRTPNRLPSFQEGSCRRRRLRGVEGSEGSNFAAEQPQMNFCEFRCFQVNPSGAPRQLPLHKGAMSQCKFRLCAAEKTKGKFKTSPPKKQQKTASRALSFSRSATAPSRREPLFVRVFSLCRKKNKGNFQDFKSKNLHIFPLWQCSASLCAFLREEGGTRERDERSPRD